MLKFILIAFSDAWWFFYLFLSVFHLCFIQHTNSHLRGENVVALTVIPKIAVKTISSFFPFKKDDNIEFRNCAWFTLRILFKAFDHRHFVFHRLTLLVITLPILVKTFLENIFNFPKLGELIRQFFFQHFCYFTMKCCLNFANRVTWVPLPWRK